MDMMNMPYGNCNICQQDWCPQFLVYGDMGRIGGSPSLKRLISEARSGNNTAVLHVGDFAYDLHSDGGIVSNDAQLKLYLPAYINSIWAL